ncbi:MAG: hypothetical protein KDD70_12940, partial [Bdellovibrionales bacterium]|nr:hypothetical protein [Bdellovibrionales bacterium]
PSRAETLARLISPIIDAMSLARSLPEPDPLESWPARFREIEILRQEIRRIDDLPKLQESWRADLQFQLDNVVPPPVRAHISHAASNFASLRELAGEAQSGNAAAIEQYLDKVDKAEDWLGLVLLNWPYIEKFLEKQQSNSCKALPCQ